MMKYFIVLCHSKYVSDYKKWLDWISGFVEKGGQKDKWNVVWISNNIYSDFLLQEYPKIRNIRVRTLGAIFVECCNMLAMENPSSSNSMIMNLPVDTQFVPNGVLDIDTICKANIDNYCISLTQHINSDLWTFDACIFSYKMWLKMMDGYMDHMDHVECFRNNFIKSGYRQRNIITITLVDEILSESDIVNDGCQNSYYCVSNSDSKIQNPKILQISDIKTKFNNHHVHFYLQNNIAIKEKIHKTTNILYLVDKITFITKMSRVRFNALETLSHIPFVRVIYWGNGWNNYVSSDSIIANIKSLGLKIDFVICYKPESIIDFDKLNIPKCMTYNEMWDEDLTLKEINSCRPDLIVCHHENDMIRYRQLSKNISCNPKFVHIPHCADKNIFRDLNLNKSIDVLLCGSIGRHYPLRVRLREIIKKMPSKYVCKEYDHPGYLHGDSFTNIYLHDFAKVINQSRICITCTSKYKYRLGKMVEIPMCNSVLACDLPNQDKDVFCNIMIEISNEMNDDQIINKLCYYLDNEIELNKVRQLGYVWAQTYVQEYYANSLLYQLNTFKFKNKTKIFLIGDELKNIKNKWICDVLKDEFIGYYKDNSGIEIINDSGKADVIWLLAPWSYRKMNMQHLRSKFVISTIHHIDLDKLDENKEYYKLIDSITNRYHTICQTTYNNMHLITKKRVTISNFWINDNNYFKINNKNELRKKYNIPANAYVVGSFQKDTEGKDDMTPKLSKGPDIFLQIIEDIKKDNPDVFVILTGWRRNYIMTGLNKSNVKFMFFELVDIAEINELYNCLDLYIVSSRVEGGPRAIIECGIAKIPIISTDVGIATLILNDTSIFDKQEPMTYRKSKPNIRSAYDKSYSYTINKYMDLFTNRVFFDQ